MTDLSKLKVVELKAKLSEAGLSTQGLKQDLINRLSEHSESTFASKSVEDGPISSKRKSRSSTKGEVDSEPSPKPAKTADKKSPSSKISKSPKRSETPNTAEETTNGNKSPVKPAMEEKPISPVKISSPKQLEKELSNKIDSEKESVKSPNSKADSPSKSPEKESGSPTKKAPTSSLQSKSFSQSPVRSPAKSPVTKTLSPIPQSIKSPIREASPKAGENPLIRQFSPKVASPNGKSSSSVQKVTSPKQKETSPIPLESRKASRSPSPKKEVKQSSPKSPEEVEQKNDVAVDVDYEDTDVSNDTSTYILISNFVRPIRDEEVKELLNKYGEFTDFWMDSIKSKAIVNFTKPESSKNARTELHGLKFPAHNPKSLETATITHDESMKIKTTDVPRKSFTREARDVFAKTRKLINAGGISIRGSGSTYPPPRSAPVSASRSDALFTKKTHTGSRMYAFPNFVDKAKVDVDKLFKKTVSKPEIYYLPLSGGQVEDKLKRKREDDDVGRGDSSKK